MIGPGCLPWRPIGRLKKHPLAYSRMRRRTTKKPRTQPVARSSEDTTVMFHSGPAEFPVAMLRSHDPKTQARVLVTQWIDASWAWMRPRTIPIAVAALGLVAILMSVDYLHNVHP